jgi:hypothetical protein
MSSSLSCLRPVTRSACSGLTHLVLKMILYPTVETAMSNNPMVYEKNPETVMIPPTGIIAQIRRQANSMSETASDTVGARGHRVDVQVYCSPNRLRFWALTAAWKRNEVRAITAQLVKKDALVMETSQFRTRFPVPGRRIGQLFVLLEGVRRGVYSLLRPIYVQSKATAEVIARAHLGRPLLSTLAIN